MKTRFDWTVKFILKNHLEIKKNEKLQDEIFWTF